MESTIKQNTKLDKKVIETKSKGIEFSKNSNGTLDTKKLFEGVLVRKLRENNF